MSGGADNKASGWRTPERASNKAFPSAVLPYAWLVAFFLAPLLVSLAISLTHALDSVPPYSNPLDWRSLNPDNYRSILSDDLYAVALRNSVRIAATTALLCLGLGYPMAYAMALEPPRRRQILLMAVILPFFTSSLIRTYAMINLLKETGLINQALIALHLVDPAHPPSILYTDWAVQIGMVYNYLPFMVLPIYANLVKIDWTLAEAARDLGAPQWKAFSRIILPLSWPGVLSGVLLVFIPACGEYVVPTLLGGQNYVMLGTQLSNEFFQNRDWPTASAVAILLLAILVVPLLVLQWIARRLEGAS
ncbi:ABC transporter permease [Rhodoblastus acidophilus]|uniref:ABC transporter permease n=1 Tax=Candidatus Rhodoblastus alkanivorans TaxID=2954117 RepID=A0ABS9Z4Z7_9HYPH|nr:ABC transporter permease [Candidatus Rhodoblastus alkanivorans]MCI4680262.1 ABC transporter permease [Candidatus Rhodoblastus alkanivorans]MCI4682749.1 ABC transporter permease [Candidatus Rhodoblastus alkanivorans]MDI4640056.1 ABC transporter permease [Rhodoblastus acidophilus]